MQTDHHLARMSLPTETWLPVPGYPDFEVSDRGRVYSRRRKGASGRMLTPSPDRKGYLRVTLNRKTVSVHRIVLAAFRGPSDLLCRHLDGNPANNNLDNIVYGTAEENMQDRIRHGTNPFKNKLACVNGHPYDHENTYRYGDHRICRTCGRASSRRYADRRRGGTS